MISQALRNRKNLWKGGTEFKFIKHSYGSIHFHVPKQTIEWESVVIISETPFINTVIKGSQGNEEEVM